MKRHVVLTIVCVIFTFFIAMCSYAAYLDFSKDFFEHWTVYFFAIYFIIFDVGIVMLLVVYLLTHDTRKKGITISIVTKAVCITIALLLFYAFIAPRKTISSYDYRPCLVKFIPINHLIKQLQQMPPYCPF